MVESSPRGIAVVDAGATNSKVLLFSASDRRIVAERKVPTRYHQGPPYLAIDAEPLFAFLPGALADLDRILPIDVIVPCAHGSALACLDASGHPALPLMSYNAEPPAEIEAAYQLEAPGFREVYCALLPLGLNHAKQLFWQEEALPADFARVRTILPWGQYVAYRLSGSLHTEVTALGAHSQLWNVPENRYSSIAVAHGWDKLFAPMAKAWEPVGALRAEHRAAGFQGRGTVLAGIHDSNANYLRYLAAGTDNFTLLSTGTWIIGFAPNADIFSMQPERDTLTNTDIFGRPVPSCRFMGGREIELAASGVPASAASYEAARSVIATGSHALPSFTASGGPLPATLGKGRFEGPLAATDAERASLASIYCAQMTVQALEAVGATGDLIVDGPFGKNPIYLSVLAELRPGQPVRVSEIVDGTAAGAALLAEMIDNGKVPNVPLALSNITRGDWPGLDRYQARWIERASL